MSRYKQVNDLYKGLAPTCKRLSKERNEALAARDEAQKTSLVCQEEVKRAEAELERLKSSVQGKVAENEELMKQVSSERSANLLLQGKLEGEKKASSSFQLKATMAMQRAARQIASLKGQVGSMISSTGELRESFMRRSSTFERVVQDFAEVPAKMGYSTAVQEMEALNLGVDPKLLEGYEDFYDASTLEGSFALPWEDVPEGTVFIADPESVAIDTPPEQLFLGTPDVMKFAPPPTPVAAVEELSGDGSGAEIAPSASEPILEAALPEEAVQPEEVDAEGAGVPSAEGPVDSAPKDPTPPSTGEDRDVEMVGASGPSVEKEAGASSSGTK